MKILIIDNFDSFVYNISQLLGLLNTVPTVVRNNQISIKNIIKMNPDAIVISPGPGHPKYKRDFGICSEVITELGPSVPILGICLGHQGIVHAFGGEVTRAKVVLHGKTSNIKFIDDSKLFEGVRNPFVATRYHSLIADRTTFPKCLRITSTSVEDGEIMSARHEKYLIEGIQFHPESVLTTEGKQILSNFLLMVKK
ncbi:anthranilate synthase component II [Candidatus Nitrosocosmicus franklandus]|uniref:anthranilate synthase n=1 Tax=Candidatus Nitrosocosmicus franklandianus TaxID=1798806 RepID=A0A484IDK5_9ARCH|nr:aminodeoxychorismate/anthranilate synthase component II [Candidatus Nitrosocosmicus franklandus]VFJ13054.1 Anthranilate synthase component 2 [Candidatus Nitrosocosmicus franklandus]